MRPRDTALAVLVAFLWGTNFIAISAGLESVPPFLFLAMRFLCVCVPAVLFVRRPALPWRDLALIGAFTSLGQFGLMYLALHLGMPPGLTSLVLQAQVLFTVVIAAVWLRERPSARQRLGVALGGAGLLTIAVGRGLSAPVLPLVVLVLAAVSWAVGNVLTRRAGPVSGIGVTVWSGLVVPLPALALSLGIEGPEAIGRALTGLPWQAVVSTLYTAGLSSLVGYGLWNTLLARHPVARVTPFAMLVPVFGMSAAAVVLGERPSGVEWVGGVILLTGVAVAVLRARRSGSVVVAVDVEPAPGAPGEPADLVHSAAPPSPAPARDELDGPLGVLGASRV
ncbi:membrane protein [Intrasporangium oryzae NRRL B-24470]|uniref:Membrane protein n=1 Tax=Intrasporangium oryzae NRRL B-24470 TaxID=1386089 RepID=W9G9U4_9MICO|nr:EamA family transporter [Intrasporangium oryzae]EWT02971.1 membrane protein [Intrasporangium oryzae NRRL B-24470]